MIKISVREAKNTAEKIQGLIGKNKPESLLIKTHFGIHTFGLKFPIDVLILDDKNNVMCIRENLRPNRIFIWNPIHEKVLELPKGTIRKNKIKIFDSIDLKIT